MFKLLKAGRRSRIPQSVSSLPRFPPETGFFSSRNQVFDQGKSHFGFFFPVSELDIIRVGGEITGGKVEKSSR